MRNATIKTLVALLVMTVFASADQALIEPLDDAFIYSKLPDTNYGDNVALVVGYNDGYLSTLILFDVSPYSGVTVDSAYIQTYIYQSNGEYSNIKIGKNTGYWTEETVTWNNRPAFDDYVSIPSIPSSGWWEIDVTSFVENYVSGADPNYGFRIGKGDTDHGNANFWSRDSAESEKPYLELNYTSTAIKSASLGNIKAAFR